MANISFEPDSESDTMNAVLSKSQSFFTNVLVVGGSFSGLSAVVALKNHLRERGGSQKIAVTLVEPKAGLLNVLGVPRAIVDPEFARSQYLPFEELDDLFFDRMISDDKYALESLRPVIGKTANTGMELTYVQGSVTELTTKEAIYQLNGEESATNSIAFDYAVIATGRNRAWPTSPLAYNLENYLKEMRQMNEIVRSSKKLAVVGAGAVGIEIAGDVKHYYPEVDVKLIHPHAKFPPEPLTDEFKDAVADSLVRGGVEVLTGLRVEKELEDHKLVCTNGEIVDADYTYWCTSFRNNTDFLKQHLGTFISPANNIYVNEYLQLKHEENQVDNIFCLGDMVEIPIIKSAGWALYMGRQVANNLNSLIFDLRLVEAFPDITQMPRGMVLVTGGGDIVSELTGEVELNHPGYVEEYKDYCMGKIRATLKA